MEAWRAGLRKAPLWIYILVSMIVFTAAWTAAAVVPNLVDGDPAFSGLFRSFCIAIGAAAVATVIRVYLRTSTR